MITILLAILFTTSLVLCFKYYERFRVNTFHAILVNYYAAALTGYFFADKNFRIDPAAPWFKFSAVLGLLFILTFMATSIATQKVSLIKGMIASKMSLVIPLTYAVIFIGEEMTLVKTFAIVLAMVGVLLTVIQPAGAKGELTGTRATLIIIAVFVGSGMVDTSFKFIETNFYDVAPMEYVMMVCYGGAACCGTAFFVFRDLRTGHGIRMRSAIAGVILGVLNYFSFYFVLEALHEPLLPSTVVFPIVNVGVLLLSTFFALLLFKERLRTLNYVGVAISILSIIALAVRNYAVQP
jgi:drug/metabolite transporter (DMT)-like permease